MDIPNIEKTRLIRTGELKPYRVMVEVAPMEGTTLPADWAGAYVNVYVCATTLVEAVALAEKHLLADCYFPRSTYSAWEIDLTELEKEQTNISDTEVGPVLADFESLRTEGGAIYSGFTGFPYDD